MAPESLDWTASFTDLHSHLVPGVDDGSRTLDEALEGLGRMREAGIVRVVTTPHLDASLTREPGALQPRLSQIDESFRLLAEAVAERFPDMELRRGQEVMLDVPDPDLSDLRVHLAETRYVLVEWPRLTVPPGTAEVLARLRDMGVTPVVAHPERYRGMSERLRLADVWRREGAVLQVNYGSLVGRYGAGPRAVAFRLLEQGWVDCLSTDFHGRPHQELFFQNAREVFEARDAADEFELLAAVNTGHVLDGEPVQMVPPIPPDRRLWSRLRGLLGAE